MKENQPKRTLSWLALVAGYILMGYAGLFFYPKWKVIGTEAAISWDAAGYYFYLPATFIYGDLKQLAFADSIIQHYQPSPTVEQVMVDSASGNRVIKYSSGQAVLTLPFFVLAHLFTTVTGTYPADGFSLPYQCAVSWGMLLIACIGLFVLRKVLLHYFTDRIVALLLLAFVFGSNYLDYSSIDNGMNHSSLFTVYSVLLWVTHSFYSNPTRWKSIWLGLLCGLAVLIRPTEIIILLIPLLWNCTHANQLPERMRFWFTKQGYIILALLGFLLFISVQLMYWKWVTGSWVVYSYAGQGFNFLHPHVLDFCFSVRCGWLRYCPMLLFVLPGIFLLFKQQTSYRLAVLVFILLNTYIVTSWEIWDYGNSSGRAMIQSYPILAFPLGIFFDNVLRRTRWQLLFFPVFLLFVYLNIWWTYHCHKGNIRTRNTSELYFKHTVGRWNIPADYVKMLWSNDYLDREPKNLIRYAMLKRTDSLNFNTHYKYNDSLFYIPNGREFSKPIILSNDGEIKPWIRVSFEILSDKNEPREDQQIQFIVKFNQGAEEVKRNMILPNLLIPANQLTWINLDSRCPKEWTDAEIFMWNPGGKERSTIHAIKIEGFE